MRQPILITTTTEFHSHRGLPTRASRLALMLGTALLLVFVLAVLIDSSVAADTELATWHDFSPQGWVNTYGVVSSVGLTSAAAPIQATAHYSVSLNAGVVWVGPYPATLTNPAGNEWQLQTGPIAVAPGQANRVRYAVNLTGGQRVLSEAHVFKMDPVAPELDVVVPSASAYISAASLSITGTATDALSGVASVSLMIGAQALTTTLTLPNWSAVWPVPTLDGTEYTAIATAQDLAGNEVTKTVTFTVDRVSPTNPTNVVETHGITNGASLPAPVPLHFDWSGATDGGGIAGYQVYWGRNAAGTTFTTVTAAEYSPPPLTQIGPYYLRIRTVDLAGNTAQWQTKFTVMLLSNTRKTFIPLMQSRSPWTRYEPNNTRATAYGPLQSGRTYEAFIWPAGDQDYYYITVTATTADITIALTNIPANADYDLYLYDSATAALPVAASAQYGTVDENIRYRPTAVGRYYIRIYPYQGANKLQPYRLTTTFR